MLIFYKHVSFLQGYGTNFYSANEYYEGEWHADKRSGWGRMYFSDGSVYEGEWFDDKRDGDGMLRLGMLLEIPHRVWCIGIYRDYLQKSTYKFILLPVTSQLLSLIELNYTPNVLRLKFPLPLKKSE